MVTNGNETISTNKIMEDIYLEPDLEDDEKNIYVFGLHQNALYYWVKALRNNKLSLNAHLIHIDYHTDFKKSSVKLNPSVTSNEIKSLIENGDITNDSFINLAMSIGIVKDITFCCSVDHKHSFGSFKNFNSPVELAEALIISHTNNLSNIISSSNIILDIDLDYFFESDENRLIRQKTTEKIKEEVIAINKLLKFASITTIARSPEMYCQEKRNNIENIFTEVFDIPVNLKKVY